jgi:hypothetical protein
VDLVRKRYERVPASAPVTVAVKVTIEPSGAGDALEGVIVRDIPGAAIENKSNKSKDFVISGRAPIV